MQPAVDVVDRVRTRLAKNGVSGTSPAELRGEVAHALAAEGVRVPLNERAAMVLDVADHLGGLGPLEALLREPGVTDVMVNAADDVWVERNGCLERTSVTFRSTEEVLSAVRRVVGPAGGRIDHSRPFVDATLPDGSRLHAVCSPIVPTGCVVTLRRFTATMATWAELRTTGSVPPEAETILRQAVVDRRAIVVCGRTGTGKTTLLARLLDDVPADERIVVIEDALELTLAAEHTVRMVARPPNLEGTGQVGIDVLVRQALRMRPDRIVVGEIRGNEIVDVVAALLTGHEGCMTSVHAASANEALVRLEGMMLAAGLPSAAIRSQLSTAIDHVVVLGRGPNGERGVVEIADVAGDADRISAATVWQRVGWSL